MTVLDIVLILIGCFLVVFSYVITERISDAKDKTGNGAVTEIWGDKEEVTIKERVKDIVSDKSEEVIDTVEDRLCHLSNEKIIEFKEYSDQVMESIKNEHKQAVFLYNMLSEKENEIKKLLNNLDKKYALLSDKVNRLILKIKERSESAAKKQDEDTNKKAVVKLSSEEQLKERVAATSAALAGDNNSVSKSVDNKRNVNKGMAAVAGAVKTSAGADKIASKSETDKKNKAVSSAAEKRQNDLLSKIQSIDSKLKDSGNKNTQITDTVQTADELLAMMGDRLEEIPQKENDSIPVIESITESEETIDDVLAVLDNADSNPASEQEDDMTDDTTTVVDENGISDITTYEEITESSEEDNMIDNAQPEDVPVQNNEDNDSGEDRNSRILSMWKEGKSVIDISRQLGIGQGEVKLVIDLFKGA